MAFKRPDIYIEEVLSPTTVGEGVSTSVASFVGIAQKGPSNLAVLISSFADFKRIFGSAVANESLFYSVRSFFQNGGSQCYVVRLIRNDSAINPASYTAIDHAGDTNLLRITSGYRGYESKGLYGNDLRLNFSLSNRFVTSYVAGSTYDLTADFVDGSARLEVTSINGIQLGDVLKVEDDATGANDIYYVKVKSVESRVVGAVVKHYVNLVGNLSLGGGTLTAANSRITLMAYNLVIKNSDGDQLESWVDLSFNVDSSSYIVTVLNDEANGSRHVKAYDLQESGSVGDKILKSDELTGDKALSGAADECTGLLVTDIIGTEGVGVRCLDGKTSVNLLCVPPSQSDSGKIPTSMVSILHTGMLEYCGDRMDMFAILDAPTGRVAASSGQNSIGAYRTSTLGVDSYWGALYYPHINVLAEDGINKVSIAPSGAVAGVYSRVDNIAPPEGGVSASPAGYGDFGLLRNVQSVSTEVSNSLHGDLNVMGVNVLKQVNQASGVLPGVVVLGARTLSTTLDFRYINVRRMMTYVEESVVELSRPYLFKNNNPSMWGRLTNTIDTFLSQLFRQGQLFGDTPEQAYFIKIDSSLNTQDDLKNGILNAEIGLALSRPAEFIVFKFSQSPLGGSEVTEV